MKNKPFIFIGLIIFFLIILLNFNTFQLATDELLKKIIHIKDKNYTLFIVIICFLNFFYFLTPKIPHIIFYFILLFTYFENLLIINTNKKNTKKNKIKFILSISLKL